MRTRPFAVWLEFCVIALLSGPAVWPAPAGQAAKGLGKADLAALRKLAAQRIRDVPFGDVVLACTGHRIIPLDAQADADRLARLGRAMAAAVKAAHDKGIRARRPNEAGNAMESFVKDALRQEGFAAGVPKTAEGKHQAAGYPDVEVRDADGRVTYLEVKIYSHRTANTTQRSFYFSPTAHMKVLADANHLLVGFEMERTRDESGQVFRPTAWKLVDLSTLRVKLKFEFNASNRDLYGKAKVVGAGR